MQIILNLVFCIANVNYLVTRILVHPVGPKILQLNYSAISSVQPLYLCPIGAV